MGRLFKFLFGLTIGAGAALLVTPKTGREVRQMLGGPQVRGLMPTRIAELTRPRDEARFTDADAATAVAEPPIEPTSAAAVGPEPSVVHAPIIEPEPELFAAPEPVEEAVVEPVVEPEPVVAAEPEPVAAAEPEPVAETEPVAEAEPEAVVAPVPVAEAEPEAVVAPVPVAEAEPEAVVAPVPVAEAEPSPPDEDLRAAIEETKTALVTEIQRPFQVVPDAPLAPPVLTPVVAVEPAPAAAEPVVDLQPVVAAEPVSEPEAAPVELQPIVQSEPFVPGPPPLVRGAGLEAELGGADGAPGTSGAPPEDRASALDAPPEPAAIPTVTSDEMDAPFAPTPAAEAPTPAAEAPPAPPYDVWSAETIPATFEPELAKASAAAASTAAAGESLPVVAEPPAEPAVEAPVVAEPPAEPAVEAPVVAEPVFDAPPVVVAAAPAEPAVGATDAAPVAAAAPAAPADEPAPGSVDQAEMRRRIEETRARLKAKAFDAMMSGEAALLARDVGDKPVPRAVDVPVDHEIAETLDESLSQDDY